MDAMITAPSGRPTLITDLARVVANYRLLAAHLAREGASPIAVVKANAYGHGAVPVATALYAAGARRFAVATLGEGLALRAALPEGRILVLGYVPPEGAPYAAEAALTLTVTERKTAKAFSQKLRGQSLRVAFKLNTGMNRWGFPTDAAHLPGTVRAVCAAAAEEGLVPEELYSHLGTAEEPKGVYTLRQRARFFAARKALTAAGLSLPAHLCASAAVLTVGACGLPLARVGLALYGYAPVEGVLPLRPASRLLCPIGQCYSLAPGEAVGYGARFVARRRERIGILPIGYADGLPRAADGGLVRVGGVPCPLIGRISMDAAAVLLSGAPREARTAVIFGEETADLWRLAAAADTIPYELLAGLGTRIDRKYIYGKDNGTCDTE